ncbi:hypothetical protein [Streptomyces sp. SID9124]|uniref:hypothetical protein n=1 Tax=Streptomyces sp. SID9124 TaxID=2706108 RepID=UPI001EF1AB0A|nr:hypothetical protein [Streptomyces sp. SID9124]
MAARYTRAQIATDLRDIRLQLENVTSGSYSPTINLRNLPSGTYKATVNGATTGTTFTSDGKTASVQLPNLSGPTASVRISR